VIPDPLALGIGSSGLFLAVHFIPFPLTWLMCFGLTISFTAVVGSHPRMEMKVKNTQFEGKGKKEKLR
jgi:hypothetical protein